jgi:ABC-2 type transport system permease protein
MIRTMPIVAITLRGLIDRRRFWLMVLLAAVPLLVAVVARVFGRGIGGVDIFDQLIISTVLPLVALVFGTAALGTELEDGTIVFLLAKPIRRSRITLAKAVPAAALTVALVVASTILTGLVLGGGDRTGTEATLAYAIAVAVGGTAYTLAFLALSAFTSRALAAGLVYILLWEGVLSGLFEGTKTFSIRQATVGLATSIDSGLTGLEPPSGVVDGTTAAIVLGAVIVGALALATWRLSRFQLSGGD